MRQEQTKFLIDSCVKEFRTWQDMICLIQMERRALTEEDAPGLNALAKRKETILSDLSKRSLALRMPEDEAASDPRGCLIDPYYQLTYPMIFETFSPDERFCIQRITEGIGALIEQMEELAQANYALAACVTKRAWALQAWLQEDNPRTLTALHTTAVFVHNSLESFSNGNSIRALSPQSQPPALNSQELSISARIS